MHAGTGVLTTRRAFANGVGKRPVAMVLVTAVLVAGTYLWQRAQLNDRRIALEHAVSAAVAARGQASALDGRVTDLQGRIGALQRSGDALRARVQDVSSGKQHVAALLRANQHRLGEATARMTALLGSPLADGRYFGTVIVVGANQTPPRLVIDLAHWLTGDAAQQAEIEYGIPPEARYDNFIENESPAWHTIEISPAAAVSIINMDSAKPLREVGTGLVGTERISLGRFAKMMSLQRLYNPFWINVSNGQVTAIQEEYTE
jgi:hypothetical protein